MLCRVYPIREYEPFGSKRHKVLVRAGGWKVRMNSFTNASGMSSVMATHGLISILVSLACIALSWWALQNLKLDLFIRQPKGPQGKLLQLLLAIILGHFVAGFIMDYWGYTQMLRYSF